MRLINSCSHLENIRVYDQTGRTVYWNLIMLYPSRTSSADNRQFVDLIKPIQNTRNHSFIHSFTHLCGRGTVLTRMLRVVRRQEKVSMSAHFLCSAHLTNTQSLSPPAGKFSVPYLKQKKTVLFRFGQSWVLQKVFQWVAKPTVWHRKTKQKN